MHRLFVFPNQIADGRVCFAGEEVRYLQKVLRLRPGECVLVFDGTGREYEASLLKMENGRGLAEITCVRVVEREPPVGVTLVQGLAKADKMDFIVQKAVEIGASCIYPVITEHAVVKLQEEKAARRVERWRKIAREACRQCGRTLVPEVRDITDLAGAFGAQRDIPGIFFYEAEVQRGLRPVLHNNAKLIREKGVFLYVGPEGGFAPSEVEMARKRGLAFAGLGPRILRTETAGLVALAVVLYELGDLSGGHE